MNAPALGGSPPRLDGFPSAEAWFAGGERLAYDPSSSTIGTAGAPLKVFVRSEGDPTEAVTFLPGYPDGSFGWAGVVPQLPNAAEMPKLFVDYLSPLKRELVRKKLEKQRRHASTAEPAAAAL